MATHLSILSWRTLLTEEPGGLQSTGSDTTEVTQNENTETTVQWSQCTIHLGFLWRDGGKWDEATTFQPQTSVKFLSQEYITFVKIKVNA